MESEDIFKRLLEEGIAARKAGDLSTARYKLWRVIDHHPENLTAWLWYADTMTSDISRLKVLRDCLAYHPENQTVIRAIQVLEKRLNTQVKEIEPTIAKPTFPTLPSQKTSEIPVPASKTKKCPYCAEVIQAEAVICRYCNRKLPGPKKESQKSKSNPWARGKIVGAIWAGLYLISIVYRLLFKSYPLEPLIIHVITLIFVYYLFTVLGYIFFWFLNWFWNLIR